MAATVIRIFTRGENVNLPGELRNFRNVKNQSHKLNVSVNETHIKEKLNYDLSYTAKDGNSGSIVLKDKTYNYSLKQQTPGVLDITIGEQLRKVQYFTEGSFVYLFDAKGDSIGFDFENDKMIEVEQSASNEKSVRTPMTGTISKVFVKVGEEVKKGAPIFAMEAMKMEHVIRAPFDCKISKIAVNENEIVQASIEAV